MSTPTKETRELAENMALLVTQLKDARFDLQSAGRTLVAMQKNSDCKSAQAYVDQALAYLQQFSLDALEAASACVQEHAKRIEVVSREELVPCDARR